MLEAALTKALPILCAYQVGACQEIFEMTNEYTRTRVVFGQPIGRFQRVQDHCVDISIHLDGARWITYETLWKIDSAIAPPPEHINPKQWLAKPTTSPAILRTWCLPAPARTTNIR